MAQDRRRVEDGKLVIGSDSPEYLSDSTSPWVANFCTRRNFGEYSERVACTVTAELTVD